MTNEQLAKEIANGLLTTHVEGDYDSVTCSTGGDYPSMGISQWEGLYGGRGDILLSYIDGGDQFAGRTYSDIVNNGEKGALKELISSEQGQVAQNMILEQDCLDMYVPALTEVLSDARCIIYCGIWCPTSHVVVQKFLERRAERGYDINNLEVLRDLFYEQYTDAAGVGEECREGYQNRAIVAFAYVSNLDLSAYEG